MKKAIILLLVLFCFQGCKDKQTTPDSCGGIYRYYAGERDSFKVWIVDGALVREKIFNEFIYGGNDERYPFVPEREIWIDNSISAKEFETTLIHEINERNLMKQFGWTYFDAHDSSLSLELALREGYLEKCGAHEKILPPVSPVDFDTTQEIESLPDKIKLNNVYRVPAGERNGVQIWIVDGFNVRRDIYPDFGFSGNGYAYKFIPENEIWIDGDITCEEMEYSVSLELKEREMMSRGIYYDSAYTESVKVSDSMRKSQRTLTGNKLINLPKILFRDTGTGKSNTGN
ncbi:MAG: hypothetical protein LWX07_10470 [Bacteroidetes bacterium]|nr:hypothetical protein [Bacteroidota bacterium]